MVPAVSPLNTYDVDGVVGRLVGVIVTNVPTPAAGVVPLLAVNVGVDVEYTSAYPPCVAPEDGNVAPLQLMVNSPDALAVALRPLACAVAGLDSVRKVISFPYAVPAVLVT